MRNKLTLDALEVLDAIDRKGSFAAAAAALYKVPSAITYTMNKLEEDLGVILFRREGRVSVLTAAGKVLLEQGRELLIAAEQLVETTRQVDTGWESCLNITIDTIFDYKIIFPILEKFYSIKADIEINIYEEVLAGSWESIAKGRSDIVLSGVDMVTTNIQEYSVVELGKLDWQFAVAQDHPLTRCKRPLTQNDIQQYRAVVVRDSSRELPALTRRIIDKQPRLTVPTFEQKIDCQIAGLGVGYLPLHRIREEIKNEQLKLLTVLDEQPQTPLHLIWKKSNKGKALRWFIKELEEVFKVKKNG
ncbi:MAG: DNA-binding transcriptional LysR family regulator [Enterobacterales bacterium]